MTMQPLKPYLVRAYYDWICESNTIPFLLVQANLPNVVVPEKYIDPDDHTIVLNISVSATNHLLMNNQSIQFQARFDGIVMEVVVPYYAVAGVYAQENEEGMMFQITDEEVEEGVKLFASTMSPAHVAPLATKKPSSSHPHLRVIKNED